jgi:branched-chain amino acid transport system ATP-binding protein
LFLHVDNVSVRYGKAEALKNVSMRVEKGEIVSLIGSNGAGKTTTLKSISGIVPFYGGDILFQGKRLNGVAPHEIVKMGIAHVPEGRRVFSSMTVKENLELGAYLRSDRASVARDLEQIYKSFPVLNDRAMQQAGSLSGGEQQMLAIARALMAGPTVLLLDEPSLGLSPKLVREVARIVADINHQGVTIILIEQNARMALRLSHRAYILELGQIILEGNAKELINDEKVKKAYLGSVQADRRMDGYSLSDAEDP